MVGLGSLGLLLLYLGITTAVTGVALVRVRDEVPGLRQAVTDGDDAGVSDALQTMSTGLERARLATAGPVWWALQHTPFVGDDVRAVRTLAAVGEDLVLGPVADLSPSESKDLASRLIPQDGRVDLAAVDVVEPRVDQLADAVEGAQARLEAVDADGLVGPLRWPYTDVTSQVTDLAAGLDAARRATQVLPAVLGQDGPRTYLVVTNNNAEVRATGGLSGTMLILRAADGAITEVGTTNAGAIGSFARPVLPQSAAEQAIYASQVATFPQDTNFTPEFPRTAELLREMVQRKEGVRVDGVIGVDAVTLSYLLRATGPLEVPGGPQLTAQNATAELLNQTYLRLPDAGLQDAYFERVAQRVLDDVVRGRPDPRTLVSALRQSVSEGRLHAHFFGPEQRAIAGTALAADVFDRDEPEVGLYLNDATGSKMSYYLRRSATLEPVSCDGGDLLLRGSATLSYTADSPPVDQLNEFVTGSGDFGTPIGQQLLLARIYGPGGGAVSNVRLDGEELIDPPVVDRGRAVVVTAIVLSRGQSVELTWDVAVPDGADEVTMALSPGMEPSPAVTTVSTRCD